MVSLSISPLTCDISDLEWKVVYVGSAEDEQYDQTLDCIMVGPVPVGVNKFVFQADAPNTTLIPPSDITGVTVVLLICSYQGQEFVRVGYYVNNEYDDELLRAEPPAIPVLSQLVRNILADKPRVTRFPIKWDAVDELAAPPPQEGQIEPDDFTMISEEEVAGMDGDDDEEEDEEEEEGEEEEEAEFEVKGSSPEHQAISVDTSKTLQNNPVHTSGTPFTMSI